MTLNKAAQALGRLNKGVKKTLTKAERRRRALRLAEARKLRWPDERKDMRDILLDKQG